MGSVAAIATWLTQTLCVMRLPPAPLRRMDLNKCQERQVSHLPAPLHVVLELMKDLVQASRSVISTRQLPSIR